MDIELQNKGVLGCVGAAWSLLLKNKRLIFKKSWLVAALYSVVVSLLFYASLQGINSVDFVVRHPFMLLVFGVISFILPIFLDIWLESQFFGCITGDYKKMFKRCLAVNLSLLGTLFVVCFGVGGLWLGLGAMVANSSAVVQTLVHVMVIGVVIALAFFMLPIGFSGMKYLFAEPVRLSHIFTKYYKEGFYYKGFILLTIFVLSLILSVILLILWLPGVILLSEYVANVQGTLMGDADGLPSYFSFLLIAVLIVLQFLTQYAKAFCSYTAYFVYLSINKRNDEKAKNTVYRP